MTTLLCPACLSPTREPDSCSACGWRRGGPRIDPIYLVPGTALQAPYQVARVLGHGGFGITYLGWDNNLEIKVAIKEYLPRDFASRDPHSGDVYIVNADVEDVFNTGLTGFLSEARTLAKFQQHPGIVSVLSYFRANGTGYMVMEYVEGETLKNYMIKRSTRLTWDQTLEIFMQVMDALRMVHDAGILHRDIAPDNIYLCGDGRVKLLDFGAARQPVTGPGYSYSVVVKPGFAAEEQYREQGEQGPWTDVYGVAASMYYCLTGQVPPSSPERVEHDTLVSPSQLGYPIPALAERALMIALSPLAQRRQQNVSILQQQLTGEVSIFQADPQQLSAKSQNQRSAQNFAVDEEDEKPSFAWQRWIWISSGLIFLMIFAHRLWVINNKPIETTPASQVTEKPANEEAPTVDERQRRFDAERAEQFKQQQAEALRRIEQRNQQQNSSGNSADQNEHKRTLCDEWSGVGSCR